MSCGKSADKGPKAIKAVFARNIFNSTGMPTVEVDLVTDLGLFRASVPSGDSGEEAGEYEALELRDENPSDYHGKGVCKAIDNVNNILGPELCKQDFEVTQQEKIDQFLIDLDKSPNKGKFGANAILGVSLAVCKAGAAKRGLPLYRHIADLAGNKEIVLPVPAFNLISGGTHAGNKLGMQEFLILPTGASSFCEAMKMGCETYHHLKEILKEKFKSDPTVSEEGGFVANITDAKEALNFIMQAISKAGYTGRIEIGIDAAGSKLFKEGLYDLDFKNPKSSKAGRKKPMQMFDIYKGYIDSFPLVSIEDPFDKEDFEAWAHMTKTVPIQLVGDDLTMTNLKRIQMAIDNSAGNCLLLRINQIGTITESIKAHLLAKTNGWGTMIAHSYGETEDTFIADLVVGLSTGQIKTGAPCRSERLAKYNQILRIEEELCKETRYAGKAFRKPS